MDATRVLGFKRGIVTCLLIFCVVALALVTITNYTALGMSLSRDALGSAQKTPLAIKAPIKLEAVIHQIFRILTDGCQIVENDGIQPLLYFAVRTAGIERVPGRFIRFHMVPVGFQAPPEF